MDGGAGNDTLIGGTGNDTYKVDSSTDVVTETSTQATEIDTVHASTSFTLGSNLEVLILTGSAAINGTGNTLKNTITGNTGANLLDGSSGDDTLNGSGGDDTLNGGTGNDHHIGGIGNDTYIINSVGDVIVENASEGTDGVQSSITYTLGVNLEHLVLTGTSALSGTGNNLNNRITGNSGANTLLGGIGSDTLIGGGANDVLTGGTENDFFQFSSTADKIDTITDFSKVSGNQDKIQVSASGFGGGLAVGTLTSSRFVQGTSATNTSQRFIYDPGTGNLFFDIDGLGGATQVQIAILTTKPNLAAADIVVI